MIVNLYYLYLYLLNLFAKFLQIILIANRNIEIIKRILTLFSVQ